MLAGCAYRPAYREPLFFETLGDDTELMVTMRTDRARDLIVYTFPQLQEPEMEDLFDRAQRVSVSTPTSPGDHDVQVYGGIEGEIPKLLTRMGLTLSGQWERNREGFVYFREDATGFEVAVPKRGIIVFADADLPQVYDRMTRDRVIYVPGELAERFLEADAAMYSQHPDGMNLFAEQLPFPFELFFDELWLTINQVDDVVNIDGTGLPDQRMYHLEGIITLPENVQARVFDRLIRVAYRDYMRKRDFEVENWRVTVNLQEQTVVFDNFLIFEDIITEVLTNTIRMNH